MSTTAAAPQHVDVDMTDLDYRFIPVELTEEEVSHLVIFLEQSLYDAALMRYVPETLPSGLCVTNNDMQSQEDLGCVPLS